MKEMVLKEAYRCLDLPPGASLLQVERTYRHKRSLYTEGNLATYALFDPAARLSYLERLEAAYRQICDAGQPLPPPATGPSFSPAAPSDPLPEPAEFPGRHLRARREAAGLSIKEIAEQTKIGSSHLMQIEEEAYEKLPSAVYLRGFILAYARLLGLADAEGLARKYLDLCHRQTGRH